MNSNLTKYNLSVGNHIVTALSQEAVNNTLKEQLYMGGDKDIYTTYVLSAIDENTKDVIYFSVDHNFDVEKIPACFPSNIRRKDLYEQLEKLNLFNIPMKEEERIEEQIKALETAYYECYLYNAFQFIQGIPSTFMPLDIIRFNPLELIPSTDPKNCGGIYTQCFKDITVIECIGNRNKFVTNIKRQCEEETPWMICYKALFNLKSEKYDCLPAEAKDAVRNHFQNIPEDNIGNLFEIQQLMVDMTNLSRTTVPDIKGVDKSTQANIIIAFETFIREYLANKLVQGYAVLPSVQNTYEYIFKPKRYSFSVTANAGNSPKTLNYIMSTDTSTIVPQNYDWNWIDQTEINVKSGVMSIHRDVFFERFNNKFKEVVIPLLRKRFIAQMRGDHHGIWDMEYVCKIEDDKSEDKGDFLISGDGKSYVYPKYSNHSYSGQISVYVPPFFAATGALTFDYSYTCSAKWGELVDEKGVQYPAIVYTIEVILYTDIDYNSGHSTGNIYHRVVECKLGIGINEYGKINLVQQVTETNKGETLSMNGWSEFCSLGQIDGMVRASKQYAQNTINEMIKTFKETFAKNFLGYANWVMLGSKSFTFNGEEFTDSGDFCTGVKYVNPARNYIMQQIHKREIERKLNEER